MDVPRRFKATPVRAEIFVTKAAHVRGDHHQLTAPFQETSTLLEQVDRIMSVLYDVIQRYTVKRIVCKSHFVQFDPSALPLLRCRGHNLLRWDRHLDRRHPTQGTVIWRAEFHCHNQRREPHLVSDRPDTSEINVRARNKRDLSTEKSAGAHFLSNKAKLARSARRSS